ncbi:MAG: TonB family protein [Candidatus Acidiferrum sp.]
MRNNSRYLSCFCITAFFIAASHIYAPGTSGQELRKRLSSPQPIYPELARRMNLSGAVKIELTISADGEIKESKVLGGHPLLADAALRALRDWKYEKAKSESKIEVEFKFHS